MSIILVGDINECCKGKTLNVETLSKLGGDQFARTSKFQLGSVSAFDVMCKFIVKIMTRNYLYCLYFLNLAFWIVC